jgi:flagellar basal-body rod modification protein FlgD
LQNQDPLNPMDNAAVTTQMAQLSTVTGIDKLNATVQALSASMAATQSLQATAMIGKTALVPGKEIELQSSAGYGAVELAQPADKLTVKITDSNGNLVRTLQLGNQDAGVVDIKWDGKDEQGNVVADGTFKFSATAVLGGKESTPTTLSYGVVGSVSLGAGGATLGMGTLGDVAISDVRRVL